MNKKKKILKTYFTIFLFVVSFFTIYAYRNDALNIVYGKNTDAFNLKKHEKKELLQQLSKIEATVANRNEAINILKPYENRFFMNVVVDAFDDEGEYTLINLVGTNGSPSKKSIEMQEVIDDITFSNTTGFIVIYPLYTAFYEQYCIFALFASALICLLFLLVILLEQHYHLFHKWFKSVFRKLPKKAFHKLSTQLLIVNIVSAVLAFGCFFFMYQNRYAFFDFVNDFYRPAKTFDKMANEIQKEMASISLTKKNKAKTMKIISAVKSQEMNVYLFDETDLYYIGMDDQSLTSSFYPNGVYDVSSIVRGQVYSYPVQAKDQYATLTIYHYPLVKYMNPYLFVIILLALSLYLIPLFIFIRKKVDHIEVMQEDIMVLASGDYTHAVKVIGEDEIAELGNHLNQMRTSFIDNMEKERQVMHANKELITSLSHDVRTPLTSLLGYLDIIRLQKYQTQEQYATYLNNCIEKVHQINTLANKTFEYAMVYEVEDEFEKEEILINTIIEYMESNIEYLKLQDFLVKSNVDVKCASIRGNVIVLKRIMNNLFSNIMKYGERKQGCIITLTQEKEMLKFTFANDKRKDASLIESNQIGLRSVKRMVELHEGEVYIDNQETSFLVVVCIPIYK